MRILFAFLLLVSAACGHDLVADFAKAINQPPAVARATFGNPSETFKTSANWRKDDWDWHANFDQGKTVQLCLHYVPEKAAYKDMADLVSAFGFSKEKGWSVGKIEQAAPMMDHVKLTHEESKTVVLLKATKGDKPGTWSVLNFFAPGYTSPPKH